MLKIAEISQNHAQALRRIVQATLMAGALGGASLAGIAIAATSAYAADKPGAQSAGRMIISSVIEVEKRQKDAKGIETVSYADPGNVSIFPGDRLRITLRWANDGAEAVSNFVATNPIHAAVKFDAMREDWAEVSVDGGATFGQLSALTVADTANPGQQRAALAEDVTHVRWRFANPIAPGESGTLMFNGSVR